MGLGAQALLSNAGFYGSSPYAKRGFDDPFPTRSGVSTISSPPVVLLLPAHVPLGPKNLVLALITVIWSHLSGAKQTTPQLLDTRHEPHQYRTAGTCDKANDAISVDLDRTDGVVSGAR